MVCLQSCITKLLHKIAEDAGSTNQLLWISYHVCFKRFEHFLFRI